LKITNKILFFILVVIIFLLAGLFKFRNNFQLKRATKVDSGTLVPSSVGEAKKFWSNRIEAIGPKLANREFTERYAKEPFGNQHLLAHMWGSLLYSKEGLNGIENCDSSFAFGCYHGFLGNAIATNGLTIVSDIDKKCIEAYGALGTGCQHGIGHGILEYLGHDQLQKSLDSCLQTAQANPLFGCTSGVFMEYNMPLILDDKGAIFKPRPFDSLFPYGPCPGLSKAEFRLSCYFELGEWWNSSIDYKQMGLYCGKLKDDKEQELCYQGVGRIAAESSSYNKDVILKDCQNMVNKKAITDCASGGAWTVFADPSVRSGASKICEEAGSSEQSICFQKANLICNYLNDKDSRKQCYVDNALQP
jgi:hypothetical protein